MKPEIKEKWVKALRSGEYKQGTGYLCNTKGEYCCLGVLTDLYSKEKYKKTYRGGKHLKKRGRDELPNDAIVEWAALPSNCPHIEGNGQLHILTNLNDRGSSFNTIADLIEQQL